MWRRKERLPRASIFGKMMNKGGAVLGEGFGASGGSSGGQMKTGMRR
ncbi:hypothetical protein SAMN04488004_11650 [Loktanella salsilacus]|uniref:Uncharacterized protein n=1 Tax=Loktanella salsilacus TaxID=195913 RepID=A0A1I4H8J1_9RHOB|nr:hypothetical protein SAMN04488004_11650 [Loktanella salsilacus]